MLDLTDRKEVGEFLRHERVRAGLSAADVGRVVGLGEYAIRKIERGDQRLSVEHLSLYSKACGLVADVAFRRVDEGVVVVPGDVASALSRYDSERTGLMHDVVRAIPGLGWDQIATLREFFRLWGARVGASRRRQD